MQHMFAKKVVLAISVSSIFDLTKANEAYLRGGEAAFVAHMNRRAKIPLKPGAAAGFLYKMLRLNDYGADVSFAIYSRQHPFAQERVDLSLRDSGFYDLVEKRRSPGDIYSNGRPLCADYLKTIDADLFLSTNATDVATALSSGFAAALVPATPLAGQNLDNMLRMPRGAPLNLAVGFDFDRVLAVARGGPDGMEGETRFKELLAKTGSETEAILQWHIQEAGSLNVPADPGPLAAFYLTICALRDHYKKAARSTTNLPNIETRLITSRTKLSSGRTVTTLRSWRAEPDWKVSSGDNLKSAYAAGLDIYFDDSERHVADVGRKVMAAHVPWPEEVRRGMFDARFAETRRQLANKDKQPRAA